MYKWELIFHISVVYLWGRISSMEPHAYIWEPRILTTWHISLQRMLRKWGRHCYSVNFSIVFPLTTLHPHPYTFNMSLIWEFISGYDHYAISQIGHFWNYIFNPQEFSSNTSSPVNSTHFAALLCSSFCFAPPAMLHFGAPAVLLFLEPLLCSSWFDGSVAASKICF